MILTPGGLAQPIAPGVPTAFLGAGAGPPPAAVQHASGPFVVPLKRSLFGSPCFEPIFSAACPLPKEELDLVVGRLNTTLAKKAAHKRIVPYLLMAGGVLTFVIGVMTSSFAFLFVGLLTFFVGGCARGPIRVRVGGNAYFLTDLLRGLPELNAQYNPRGIDFRIIEWDEFVLTAGLPNTGYCPQMAGNGPQEAGYGSQVAGYGPQVAVPVRQVWKHALLIRALQPEQLGFAPSDPQ